MSPHTADARQQRRDPARSRRALEQHPTVGGAVARSRLLARFGATEKHPPVPRKPLLRGWIHAAFTPVVFVLGLIAMLAAPSPELRIACAVYGATGLLLFGVSGIYHRSYWSPRFTSFLRRFDHCNIALLIAGTYTPLALALLEEPTALLIIIWGCAAGLIAFRLIWMGAPRWLYTPLYIVMGCIAVAYLPVFWPVSPGATVMLAVGGAAYIGGAVVYALRRPALAPLHFGFHEVFHSCTVIGFVCHYIAIMLAMPAGA
ncbi:hemolysin III family protein [Kocuria palustris]|uniref:PAQR family membrane homeostasis protein TrhA n=1 Tax=Kocuria palustris TaxID=71999 RepID=UPI0011A7C700|nr:hemolysin III family protein [Kocuria palustris]